MFDNKEGRRGLVECRVHCRVRVQGDLVLEEGSPAAFPLQLILLVRGLCTYIALVQTKEIEILGDIVSDLISSML